MPEQKMHSNNKLNLDDLSSYKNFRDNIKKKTEKQSFSLQKNDNLLKSNNVSCNTSISEDIHKSDRKKDTGNLKLSLLK